MLGIPAERRDQFKARSDAVAAWLGNVAADPQVDLRAQEAVLEATEYFGTAADELRQNPKEDLLTGLALAEQDGDRLTHPELAANALLLLAAGHETTTNLIGNGVLALLRHPDQLRLLRQDQTLLEQAVEELLRYDSPVQALSRLALQDVDLAGANIPAGTLVVFVMGSANRDPARFSRPDELDIRRTDGGHLSFAHGIHFCLGAFLARTEAQLAIRELLQRYPGLALDEEPTFQPNITLRGPQRLAVSV